MFRKQFGSSASSGLVLGETIDTHVTPQYLSSLAGDRPYLSQPQINHQFDKREDLISGSQYLDDGVVHHLSGAHIPVGDLVDGEGRLVASAAMDVPPVDGFMPRRFLARPGAAGIVHAGAGRLANEGAIGSGLMAPVGPHGGILEPRGVHGRGRAPLSVHVGNGVVGPRGGGLARSLGAGVVGPRGGGIVGSQGAGVVGNHGAGVVGVHGGGVNPVGRFGGSIGGIPSAAVAIRHHPSHAEVADEETKKVLSVISGLKKSKSGFLAL